MDAQLQQISSKPNSEQPAAYQALIDATASSQDVGGMRTILERLLSDAVPQAASRAAAAHFAQAIQAKMTSDATTDLLTWSLEQIKRQAQSFEACDATLRQALFSRLVDAGDYREAALVLGGTNVENSARQYSAAEKATLYVTVAETFLEEDESVDAEAYVSRASGLMRDVSASENWALHLRYRVTLARTLDARRKFLDASMRYYELSRADDAKIDREELTTLLAKAVTCALLGNAGPQRSRILTLLYKDERLDDLERSADFAGHARVLKRTVTGQLVRTRDTSQFMASLMPHQTALLSDGLTIPEAAMIQHNLVAVAHIYCNISIEHCAQLLDVAPGRVETTAAKMIAAGRLAASLDQVDGVLHFHATQNALDSFDESIKALCLGVNACYEHAEQLAA